MVTMAQVLEYRLIFPDEPPRDFKDYISGIDKQILLKAACFFSMVGKANQNNKELLSNWFQAGNQDFLTDLWNKVHALERDKHIVILNPVSSLMLFGLVLSEWETTGSTKSELDSEKELFKLYLLLNEKYSEKDHVVFESTSNLDRKCHLEAMYFSNSFVDCDLTNYEKNKVIITQFQKAFLLFQEFEQNGQFKELLSEFCSYYLVDNWKEYLKKVLPLIFTLVRAKKEGNVEILVEKDEHFEENCDFLEKFAISDSDSYDIEYDFLELRSRPLFVVERGKYIVVSEIFLCERLFKGLYFKLNVLNTNLANPVIEFKSKYNEEFSEKQLLYSVLNHTFKDRYKKFSGEELRNLKLSGEPDYYIRNRNNVILFESKDILIPAIAKTSGDFKLLKKEFRKRLYFDVDHKKHRIKPKAILQLIGNVKKLLTGEDFVKIDTELAGKKLNIFPVLVLHDNLYNAIGLNRLVNYWFQKELLKMKEDGINVKNVRPLVILDIDTMIHLQEAIRKTHCSYEKFLDEYIIDVVNLNIRKARSQNQAMSMINRSMISFSFYLEELSLIKKNWSLPVQFEEY